MTIGNGLDREKNQQAGYLSRLVGHDDWMVYFPVDRFNHGTTHYRQIATHYNQQLPRFNSRFWNPDSEAVDAFTRGWSGENNWLCPPVYLIPRLLRHEADSKAVATYWPMLCLDGLHLAEFVHVWMHTPQFKVKTHLSLAEEGQTFSKQGSQTQLY